VTAAQAPSDDVHLLDALDACDADRAASASDTTPSPANDIVNNAPSDENTMAFTNAQRDRAATLPMPAKHAADGQRAKSPAKAQPSTKSATVAVAKAATDMTTAADAAQVADGPAGPAKTHSTHERQPKHRSSVPDARMMWADVPMDDAGTTSSDPLSTNNEISTGDDGPRERTMDDEESYDGTYAPPEFSLKSGEDDTSDGSSSDSDDDDDESMDGDTPSASESANNTTVAQGSAASRAAASQ
jgi:hypothetical protein